MPIEQNEKLFKMLTVSSWELDMSYEQSRAQLEAGLAPLQVRYSVVYATVTSALDCPDTGAYVNCEHCGDAIGLLRLDVVPQTARGLKCA